MLLNGLPPTASRRSSPSPRHHSPASPTAHHRRRPATRADRRRRRHKRHPRRQHIGHLHRSRRIRAVVRTVSVHVRSTRPSPDPANPPSRSPHPHRRRRHRVHGRRRGRAVVGRRPGRRSTTTPSQCCSTSLQPTASPRSSPSHRATIRQRPQDTRTVAVPLHEPTDVDDDTNDTPAGSTSVTFTPAAASGPRVATVNVHVRSTRPSPDPANQPSRSTDPLGVEGTGLTVVVVVELLLADDGSSVDDDTVAVLLNEPAADGVTTIVTVTSRHSRACPRTHDRRRPATRAGRRGRRHKRHPRRQRVGDLHRSRRIRAGVGHRQRVGQVRPSHHRIRRISLHDRQIRMRRRRLGHRHLGCRSCRRNRADARSRAGVVEVVAGNRRNRDTEVQRDAPARRNRERTSPGQGLAGDRRVSRRRAGRGAGV